MQHPIYYIKNELKSFYLESELSGLARLILEKSLGISFADILACKFNNLSDAKMQKLAEIVGKLKNSEPIQYILGETEFLGLPFFVNDSVLIPRPETEELVQWIIDSLPKTQLRVLDIGTGSGCIAVTLAKKLSLTKVDAWDISGKALDVAQKNAEINGVIVNFSQKDILRVPNVDDVFDVIVSNPPYIAESEKNEMERNVLDFEPHVALFVPDDNALVFYEKIADFALKNLKAGGKLFFEINRAKGEAVVRLLKEKGFKEIELREDISGNERMIKAIPKAH